MKQPCFTWVLRLPSNCETTCIDSVVRAKPEIQGIVRAIQLLWVILATVFSNHVSRGAVPIMNLKEVKVAVGAVLQMKVREGNTENLKTGHIMQRISVNIPYLKKNHINLCR